MNRRDALLRALFAGGLGGAAMLAGCHDGAPGKPGFHAVDITGADYARDFSLPDVEGRTRTLADFKGKVVLLFFGYAQCPDVCPTTMAQMHEVRQQLGAQADRFQVVFITVDPERDTPQVMKNYMASFDPGFVALIPTTTQLAAMADDFKLYYKKVDGRTPTSYLMEHTAASYVYDPQGRLRLYVRYGTEASALVDDVKALLAS